jgi:uncharacterized membrane protein
MPSSQHSPKQILLIILILAFLFAFIQISAITIVFEKLGLSVNSAMLLFFCSLLGSTINLPVFNMEAEKKGEAEIPWYLKQLLQHVQLEFKGRTIIAVNVGGCLIPLAFSIYLFSFHKLEVTQVIGAVAVVSAISYLVSRPIHGIGVGMPVFVAPITAAVIAVLINPEQSAPIAYICGTMGVLIGADLFRLKDIKHMGVPIASIGGAGTFDGIFITGLVAVLLA